ncbi:MAG TPA: hypothetical protein VEL11_08395 [Candidatus Bathyarchaeia archaeon]|nr:hypothetical protein [Candidatus Bathyarchaeia archaeon]
MADGINGKKSQYLPIMIAVDMDPIMRPWSIRDRCIWIRNQKGRKPDQEPENNGADAGTTFVEQVG